MEQTCQPQQRHYSRNLMQNKECGNMRHRRISEAVRIWLEGLRKTGEDTVDARLSRGRLGTGLTCRAVEDRGGSKYSNGGGEQPDAEG